MSTEINTSSPLMMFISSLTTGVFILFSHLLTSYQNIHLPPIVIESMQVISYLGAIVVSFLTIYNFISKKRKKNGNSKES